MKKYSPFSVVKQLMVLVWRLYAIVDYVLKYKVGFFCSSYFLRQNTKSLPDLLDGKKSIAIIGKGASVFESNPIEMIDSCDYKILLSSVDVENLEDLIGVQFDAQMTSRVDYGGGIMPVFSKEWLGRYKINTLICNCEKTYARGRSLLDYCRMFSSFVDFIGYYPSKKEIYNRYPNLKSIDPCDYGGGAITNAGNLLFAALSVESIEKIVFVGVDAYHYGYSQSEENERKYPSKFFSVNTCTSDPLKERGVHFLSFLFDICELVSQDKEVAIYFPLVLKDKINFPDKEYYKFY